AKTGGVVRRPTGRSFLLRGLKPMPWGRALAQPATYFGMGLIAFIAVALVYVMREDRRGAHEKAGSEGEKLAPGLREHGSRTINSADATVRVLSALYRQNPKFDIVGWTNNPSLRNEVVIQVTFIDAHGRVVLSSVGTATRGTDLSDREHFRVHANSKT